MYIRCTMVRDCVSAIHKSKCLSPNLSIASVILPLKNKQQASTIRDRSPASVRMAKKVYTEL